MKDLQVIAKQCMRELDVLGIEYGEIVSFEVNKRAKKRWGQCKVVSRNKYSINISYRLLEDDAPMIALKNTVIHEILHTCNGCWNHGETWKNHADKVNRVYGYGIKRCSSAEEKGIKEIKEDPKKIKHRFVCKGCGQTVDRMRESKFTKYHTLYRCGRCGCKFDKVF